MPYNSIKKVNGYYFLVYAGSLISILDSDEIGKIQKQIISKYNLLASQIFDNNYIWGHRHLYSAIWHAINAEINQSKIANSLSMEILLYAAGYRQIKKAIEFLGIKNTTKEIVGVLVGQSKQQLMDAELELKDYLHFQSNLDLIDDFSSKIKYILEILTKEGYSVKDFSILDIEKVIFQRIALLALES